MSSAGRRSGEAAAEEPVGGASLAECLLVGFAVALAVHFLRPGPYTPGSYGDDGVYLALGKALADGDGYRSIYAVGAPFHVKFPPLYPALLSIFWRVDPSVFAVVRLARIANALFLGGAAALLWPLGRNRLGISRVPLAAFVLGPLLLDASLHYFALPLTEPLFILLWAVALVLGDRLASDGGTRAPLAFGLILAAAALTRAQGLALIAAAPIALAVRRVERRRALVALLAAVLPVIGWLVVRGAWIAAGEAAGAEGSYLRELLGGGARAALSSLQGSVLFNLRGYPGLLAPYLAPGVWGRVAVGLLIALALVGMLRLRRRAPFLVASLALQAALVAVWPYTVDRLALSILPFAGLAAAHRVDMDLRRLPARLRPLAARRAARDRRARSAAGSCGSAGRSAAAARASTRPPA